MLQTFLRSDVAEKLERLYKSRVAPTAAQREEFSKARAARPRLATRLEGARASASAEPENYAVVGSVAQICIEGVLAEEPDFLSWLMGCDGTTYGDIRDALAQAAADPMVKSVVLDFASPGGHAEGLFETMAAIEAFPKPIAVQASEAQSAAYGLAAITGSKITALGPASSFGSIGVVRSYCFDADVEVINVTSTDAPNKRPDPRTPEGKAVIVSELDAIHELFADAIARGRSKATGKSVTVAQVNADFGRGSTLLASAALAAGLIDKMPKATGGTSTRAAADPVAAELSVEPPLATPPAPQEAPPVPEDEAVHEEKNPIALGKESPQMTEKNSFPTTMAIALGLAAGSTEADIVTAASRYRENESQLLAILGVSSSAELLGAARGTKTKADLADAQGAELQTVKAERDKQNFETLVAKGKTAPIKLSPATARFYEEKFAAAVVKGEGAAVVADLQGFLAAAPTIFGASNVRQPEVTNASAPLVWNGKSYAELSYPQRAKLAKEDPALWTEMKRDFEERAAS